MDQLIKRELHQLIDECDNELLLEEAKAVLKSDIVARDWCDELTEEDKNMVRESESSYKKGDYISHEELMKRFKEWKKK